MEYALRKVQGYGEKGTEVWGRVALHKKSFLDSFFMVKMGLYGLEKPSK